MASNRVRRQMMRSAHHAHHHSSPVNGNYHQLTHLDKTWLASAASSVQELTIEGE